MSTVKYLPKYGKFHSSWRCCWQQKIDHRDHKVINTYSIGIRLLEVSKVKALESIFFSFFFLLSWPLFFGPPSFLLAKLVSGRKIIGFPYHVYGKSYWASSFFPWSKNRRKNVPCGLASFLVFSTCMDKWTYFSSIKKPYDCISRQCHACRKYCWPLSTSTKVEKGIDLVSLCNYAGEKVLVTCMICFQGKTVYTLWPPQKIMTLDFCHGAKRN